MISHGKPSLTVDDVRAVTTDAAVASHYLYVNSIPTKINSPYRRDDKPSLGLYSFDGEKIMFKDFGTNEGGDIYTLLSKMWNIDRHKVYEKVYKDMAGNRTIGSFRRKNTYKSARITTTQSELEVKTRDWEPHDIEFWKSFGISLPWLRYADVYPISHKIITKGNDRMVFCADKYAYAYVEHKEGKTTLKIYQPYNTQGFKWSSKHDRSVISLWTKVPQTADRLCICSSLKDALCLSANTGIPAIATQGEGYSMSESAIKSLKERYGHIYIMFDNDEAGLIDGVKLAKETGFTNLILPKIQGAKDISDLYKVLNNKQQFKNIILNIFNNGSSQDSNCNFRRTEETSD